MEDMPQLEIVPTEILEETVEISYEDLSEVSLKTKDIFVHKPHPTNDVKPKGLPERAVKKKVVRIKEPEPEVEEEPEEVEEEEHIEMLVAPVKKKKPLSEKQRLHLQKARVKALEKKKAMRLKKEEINKRVKAEVEEEVYSQKAAPPPQQDKFELFLSHMSQFKNYETLHLEEERKRKERAETIKTKVAKIISPAKPAAPPVIVSQKPKNMYASAFEW
tara:strand:+ start:312 stop:965 length:654 start_codon:yes stop_codon:yes gene_type:complete